MLEGETLESTAYQTPMQSIGSPGPWTHPKEPLGIKCGPQPKEPVKGASGMNLGQINPRCIQYGLHEGTLSLQ